MPKRDETGAESPADAAGARAARMARMERRAVRLRERALDPTGAAYSEKTHLVHGRYQSARWDYMHHVVPPQSSSVTYRLDSSHRGAQGFTDFGCGHVGSRAPIYIYDRLDEPTRGMLEENLAYAECGEAAVCFATGMAAISAALMVLVKGSEEIVAHEVLYGCTFSLLRNWLPRYGITTRTADLSRPARLLDAVTPATRVIYCETPVNPDLSLLDIRAIRDHVDRINADRPEPERVRLVVDNTFATPYCQRPLLHGADVVVASLTKSIGGFGTDMGGVVIGPAALEPALLGYRKDFGGVLSPKSAWPILVYGLPTLPVRIRQQQHTALKVARFLEGDPRIRRVSYPGLESFPQAELARRQLVDYENLFAPGTLIYFVLCDRGEPGAAAEAFIDHVAEYAYSVTMAVSLGQVKTLIEHPYSMTHAALTTTADSAALIERDGIRLSIGLEKGEDIIRDLSAGLDAVFQS